MPLLPTTTFDLPAELARWRRLRHRELSPERNAAYDRATDELIRSFPMDRVARVGDAAPRFTLPNAVGGTTSLASLLRAGPVVLSFYRGVWCPFCNVEQRALQQQLPTIAALGASVVAISGMTPDHSMSMVDRLGLAYEVLSDAGLAVARDYGLVFELPDYLQDVYEESGHPLARFNVTADQELPLPATFVVDQGGVVRFADVPLDYMCRADPADLVQVLSNLQSPR